jgi:hypothetical protein
MRTFKRIQLCLKRKSSLAGSRSEKDLDQVDPRLGELFADNVQLIHREKSS